MLRTALAVTAGTLLCAATAFANPGGPNHGMNRLQRLIDEAEQVLASSPNGYRTDVLVIIDYGVHSSLRRFFVVDRRTHKIEGYRAAHGIGSDPQNTGYAREFSNANRPSNPTKKTCVGVFRTAETYTSRRLGYSLRMDGMSGTNSQARARGIVIHRAPRRTRPGDKVGLSWGGPALDPEEFRDVVEKIKGGTLVYAPHPSRRVRERARQAETNALDPRSNARSVTSTGSGRVVYQGHTVSSSEVRAALQRIANLTGRTVRVTSGDRHHVPTGGSRTSLHLAHRAADFTVIGMSLGDVFQLLRDNQSTLLPNGGYEVIWHQPNTNTGGPHLHLGHRGPSGQPQFKTENRGTYTVVR